MINYPAPPIPIVKETFLYRKPPSTASTNSPTTISAPPHTIVTVASPTPAASFQLNSPSKGSSPQHNLTTEDEESKRPKLKRKISSQKFDVDELEAAEQAYLDQLASGGNASVENDASKKIASPDCVADSYPSEYTDISRDPQSPSTSGRENVTEDRMPVQKENDSSPEQGQSPLPPRKVHQPPATPPSEPDDEDE